MKAKICSNEIRACSNELATMTVSPRAIASGPPKSRTRDPREQRRFAVAPADRQRRGLDTLHEGATHETRLPGQHFERLAADCIATAAGANNSDDAPKPEVGDKALELAKVQEMKSNLKSNPPKPFDIVLAYDGKQETLKVDEGWLKKERKRIEDEYTFQINNFERVILYSDRESFDKAAERFRVIVEKYQAALSETLTKSQAEFEKQIVDEFSRR